MKRSICIVLIFTFIFVLLASCANATNTVIIGGNRDNEQNENSMDLSQQESEQLSDSTPIWLYVLIFAIGLPLFVIGIFIISRIIQAYRNRYYH
jgi:glucan phosphoethanolaminetransferase (alkaline phosphatase superfamily)